MEKVSYEYAYIRSDDQIKSSNGCRPYRFLLSKGGLSNNAFVSAEEFARFLDERGLKLSQEKNGEQHFMLIGEYITNITFEDLPEGQETRILSNGDYTRATITELDGLKVINYHNPNVKNRVVYDYFDKDFANSYKSKTVDLINHIVSKINSKREVNHD